MVRFRSLSLALIVAVGCAKNRNTEPVPLTAATGVSSERVQELQGCETLDPETAGFVDYTLLVGPEGVVLVVLESEISNVSNLVVECSEARATAWTFAPTGEVVELKFRVDYGDASSMPGTNPPVFAELIKEGLRPQVPELRECYEKAIRYAPDIRGSVHYRMVVKVDGSVSDIEFEEVKRDQ